MDVVRASLMSPVEPAGSIISSTINLEEAIGCSRRFTILGTMPCSFAGIGLPRAVGDLLLSTPVESLPPEWCFGSVNYLSNMSYP